MLRPKSSIGSDLDLSSSFGGIYLIRGAVTALQRSIHPAVPRRCVLSGEVNTTFGALSNRKERCHLTRFEVGERATRPLIFVPDHARSRLILTVEPAEQSSHLTKREALAVIFGHGAEIERALATCVGGKNASSAGLRRGG